MTQRLFSWSGLGNTEEELAKIRFVDAAQAYLGTRFPYQGARDGVLTELIASESLVSVTRFGAVAGATNNSVALQRAIDSGEPLWLPRGIWKFEGLTVTQSLHLRGAGASSVLQVISGSTQIPILIQDTGIDAEIPYVYLGYFKMDGNLSGQLDAGLIQCNNGQGWFEKIWITGAGTPGTSTSAGVGGLVVSAGAISAPGSQVVVRDCLGEYCTKAPFNITTEAINCLLDGCIARYNTGNSETPGFQVNGSINVGVRNCWSYNNQGNGFVVGQPLNNANSKYVTFAGCHSYRNGQGTVTGHGFAVLNSFASKFGHLKFDHCFAYENGVNVNSDGFNVQNYNDVELDHCEAYKNKLSGFLAATCTNVDFDNCKANHNGVAGVGGGGFLLYALTRFTVKHCRGYDDDSVPTQQYGLIFYTGTACTDGEVAGNTWHPGNTLGAMQVIVVPTNTRLELDTSDGTQAIGSAKLGQMVEGVNSEEVTLATGAATTDSVANLLPAGALILAVTARVTTTITTAVSWQVGDAGAAARFIPSNATMTAGTTAVGLDHLSGAVSTLATGPSQAAAAKVRITLNANPGAGKIRVEVWYRKFVAPTS